MEKLIEVVSGNCVATTEYDDKGNLYTTIGCNNSVKENNDIIDNNKQELNKSNKSNMKVTTVILSLIVVIALIAYILCGCSNNDITQEEDVKIANIEFDSEIYKLDISMPDFICYKDTINEYSSGLIVISETDDKLYNNPDLVLSEQSQDEMDMIRLDESIIPNDKFDKVAYEYESGGVKIDLFYYKDADGKLYSITYSDSSAEFENNKQVAYGELSKIKFVE